MGKLTLYTPHAKQLEIHEALDREEIMYCVVPTGRQFGKTLLGINQALKWAVEEKSWSILWVSPTYKQCKKVFRQLLRGLNECPYLVKKNESDLILTFDTGSQIVFYSAEAYDTIRGESADALVLDEFRFYPDQAYDQGIKPALTVKGKKVLIISTTKGTGEFYKLFMLAVQGRNRYVGFTATSYDNPFANVEEIEDARHTLPDHIFRQEYLAEFIEDGSSVFTNVQECIKPQASNAAFAGIDLGRADDYTVLTIEDEHGTEVYCERWRHLEWSTIIDKIVTQLNKYKPKCYIEANGTQDAIFEQIKNKITYNKNSIQPFTTTSKTKPQIIEDLIVQFENKEAGIIGKDWQIAELNTFTYEYNPRSRTIKYSAPSGLHDDYVMSKAICGRARKDLKMKGKYILR